MDQITDEIRRLCEPFMRSEHLSAIECVQRLIEEIDHRDKYPLHIMTDPKQPLPDDLREHLVEGQAIMEGLVAENERLRSQFNDLKLRHERLVVRGWALLNMVESANEKGDQAIDAFRAALSSSGLDEKREGE